MRSAFNPMGVIDMAKDYIIDYGSNSNGWYRKWKSGFIEQWGFVSGGQNIITTITLPKNYNDTNYFVTVIGTTNTLSRSTGTPSYRGVFGQIGAIDSKNIDSFIIGNGININWYTCGY